ncbi:hypothetical protein PQ455_14275 [Sphingomonas naphthae]|uniref:DUF2384 domain-containing protein n=1 Tax=Sphingomonas naphthae TaxID=1813468 RepID=A0ABY7TIC2_9SPHN|nr:hypothetical protein [Sphingomonas naphthae]WCT72793.1 hypothetical protein PQ455_14275 [Sphingomonas naphthae]
MSRPFQKRPAPHQRLTPEQAARQGRAATLAFEKLRQSEAVIAFLNTHDDSIGGRPIDLAVTSADGLASVEQLIASLPKGTPVAA